MFAWLVLMQGSRYRATRAMKSSCEGQLHLLVGQKRRSSPLVILKSPEYFCQVSFMKMLKCMVFNEYFESDFLVLKLIHFGLMKLSFHSITNKNSAIAIMQGAMWNIFNWTNFWLIFSPFLWHKILVLIFDMFIYVKVDHSKSVEMHEDISDFDLYMYTRLKLWSIYQTVYMQTGVNLNTSAIRIIIIITAFTSLIFWLSI